VASGAVAFSDDGDAVADGAVMERALLLARELEVPLAQHAEDSAISGRGAMHDGEVARDLGVTGWPPAAETEIVARDLKLSERTGAHVHVQHVSTRGTVALIRRARERGVRVTAEVTPHHLHLTDRVVREQGALAKVNPPLREEADVQACREGLADGTIDIVASDHAPHTAADKQGGLERAAYGMVGLETSVPLILALVEQGVLSPTRMIEAMSTGPARVFGLPGGILTPGSVADVTLIDPERVHVIDPGGFRSKGRNTPFAGRRAPGKAVLTIVGGRIVHNDGPRLGT
jgi:dihydroorotase